MNEENFSPSQPVLEPEKNNAKLVIVIAIIVAIVAITAGVIGFLLAKKTQAPATAPVVAQPAAQTSEAKTASDVQKPVVQPAETTQSADETTGWKTYTNNRVNYQFEYPASGLTLAIDETIKYPSTKAGDSKTEDLVQFATDKTSYSIQTEIGINHDSIESWIKDTNVSNADGNISLYTKTFIGGKVAYTSKAGLVTYVYNNGNIYSIIARSGIAPSNDKNDSIYSHLLSTFKFTNAVADETADWKTYKNTENNFEIKYPLGWKINQVNVNQVEFYNSENPKNDYWFKIDVIPNLSKTLDAWTKDKTQDTRYGKQTASVVGLDALKFIASPSTQAPGNIEYDFIKNNTGYILKTLYLDTSDGTGEKMFSTFKFTN